MLNYALLTFHAIPVSFAALMPVINPIGTAIILLSLTAGASSLARKDVARAVAINSTVLLTALLFLGSYMLAFFGISVEIVQAAGGIVLAGMGWQLLNAKDEAAGPGAKAAAGEPAEDYSASAFYPFTFPITVGPGAVAVTLTLSAHTTRKTLADTACVHLGALLGIIGIGIVTYLCIAYSHRLSKRLGPTGTQVMMRLIAFIVVCIGAQISWTGWRALMQP